MKYTLYSLLLIALTVSCTKEIPYPNVDQADFIVLNGLLNPEMGARVHLSQSCHISDSQCDEKFLTNAQVFLNDASGTILAELVHTDSGIYEAADFEIEPNTTYEIEASSINLPSVKAKTTSPKSFTCELIEFDEEIYQDNLCRTFTVDIFDNPDETNYYLVNGYVDILNGEHDDGVGEINGYIQPHTGFFTKDVNAENNVLVSSIDIIPYALDFVFLKDDQFNGEQYQLKFGLFDWDLNFDPDYELRANISVKSVSKDLYDYYRSVTLYKLTSANLIAEPQQVFDNIEDGVGIFGSYTEQKFVVDLPGTEFWYNGNMTITNEGCAAPCEVQFGAEMGEKVTAIWDFGDGSTSIEQNPTHTYQQPGTYLVSLGVSIGEEGYNSSQEIEIN